MTTTTKSPWAAPPLDHVPVEPEYTARPISFSLIMAAFVAGIVGLIAALLAGPAL